jgi:NADH:ubiquinone oxidoreductase subunit H
VLGFTFTTYIGFSLLVYSSSLLPCIANDLDLLLYLCLSGLLGVMCLVPTVVVSNRYVAIGTMRQLRAMILADIGLETSIVVLLLFFITVDSSSDHVGSSAFSVAIYGVLFTPVFILVLIAAARAPFDLPEAESELIAGPLTDLGGSAFSFCLLLDYMELLTWVTIFAVLVTSLSLSSALVLALVLVSYVGRLILVRLLLADVPKLIFLVLL